MQGAEDEVEGSVLTYVTETEFRKQRSRSPSCNSLSIGIGHTRSGDQCARDLSLFPSTPCGSPCRDPLFPRPLVGRTIKPLRGVRHPCGVAGSLTMPDPRVIGASPLDPGLKSGHPCRGALFTILHKELNSFCTAQCVTYGGRPAGMGQHLLFTWGRWDFWTRIRSVHLRRISNTDISDH